MLYRCLNKVRQHTVHLDFAIMTAISILIIIIYLEVEYYSQRIQYPITLAIKRLQIQNMN